MIYIFPESGFFNIHLNTIPFTYLCIYILSSFSLFCFAQRRDPITQLLTIFLPRQFAGSNREEGAPSHPYECLLPAYHPGGRLSTGYVPLLSRGTDGDGASLTSSLWRWTECANSSNGWCPTVTVCG